MGSSSKLLQLKESVKGMRSINEKQEKRVRYLETKLTRQGFFYILFQLVIFLSISKPSSISCAQWRIPFSLSLLLAIIFGLTFATTFNKWARTKFEYDRNLMEESLLFYQLTLAQRNPMEEGGSTATVADQQNSQPLTVKPDMMRLYLRRAYIYFTYFALIAYTAVILRACRSIPCHFAASAKS